MSKKTILMLTAPLMVLSNSVSAVETVKVFDGTVKTCTNKSDVYHNRNGVYRAKALRSETKGQKVELTVKLEFFTCEKTRSGYKFVETDPYADTQYDTYTFNEGVQSIQVQPVDAQFQVYQDGVFKIIERKDLNFKAVQNHTVEIDLDDLKSKASVDLSVSKNVVLDTEEFQMMDTIHYGAYRVHFEVIGDKAILK